MSVVFIYFSKISNTTGSTTLVWWNNFCFKQLIWSTGRCRSAIAEPADCFYLCYICLMCTNIGFQKSITMASTTFVREIIFSHSINLQYRTLSLSYRWASGFLILTFLVPAYRLFTPFSFTSTFWVCFMESSSI